MGSPSPRKRKAPTERNFGTSSLSSAARKLDTSAVIVTEEPHSFENDDENFAENHDMHENTQCISAAKRDAETQTEPEVGSEVAELRQQILELKAKLEVLQKQLFTVDRFKDDDSSVRFYTGFPNWHTMSVVYNYLNPGVEGENITYWLSQSNLTVPADFYEDEEKEEPSRKRGRSRSLRPIDEFFVVLCRLRQGLPEEHLAHLFQVSVSTISRLFITWINFMFLRLGQINIWPSREAIDKAMPEDFKKNYSSTRVVIDCTEVRCQMPSSLQEIASLWIHVERAINKIKNFHIWDGVIPLHQLGVVNQMWAICAILCNAQANIISI